MKELIKVIAFDADDTLWSNEPFFQEIEKQYTDLLKPYGTSEDISAALFQTEMNNLKYLGYGAKAFTISMVETALHVSGQKISGTDIQHIIELGKSLLKMPIELLLIWNVEKSKPSFFRKNIAISYPNAKRKYFAVYVKDYLVKK